MSLDPLLSAPPVVQIHAFVALLLVLVTGVQFAGVKGSAFHRVLGWVWVIGMALVAATSFAIQDMRLIGPFSPIHLLSVLTLGALVGGVRAVRRGDVTGHAHIMRALSIFALGIAGAFTLLPGRLMWQVVSGG
ncbi:MAG: DUF2306 domain-containing protein [Pseudomonadota bacterium]